MPTAWPLVDRQDELRLIAAALSSHDGAVLTGPAGVGKSRLAHAAVRRPDGVVRWIAATVTGQSIPLGALAGYTARCGPDPLLRVQEVIHALVDGESSVLLCVDDAHLLDDQSALVIERFVEQAVGAVVMTVRDGEPLPDSVAALCARLPRISVPPLTTEGVSALVTQVLGAPLESSSAHRFFSYTRGNALYLRQLVTDEVAAGRLTRRSDVWVWDGPPRLSASLVDLLEASMGNQPDAISDLLDVLAVSDPVELPVLLRFVGAAVIDDARDRVLITVDDGLVRLAHPLFGEVRRNRAGTARLRKIRGRVAELIGQLCAPSAVQTVRRAVLLMDSDTHGDPAFLVEAANAALQLLDLDLAARLAEGAVAAGGGRPAQATLATMLAFAGQGVAADAMFAELADTDDAAERASIALLRAANLSWVLARPSSAETVLNAARDAAEGCGLGPSYLALHASCRSALGHPREAVEMATAALTGQNVDPLATMFGYWALVGSLGDLGHVDRMADAAAAGYELAATAPQASHLRFGLGLMEIAALHRAGTQDRISDIANRLRQQSLDVVVSRSFTAAILGYAELCCGRLESAQRWLRESLATGSVFDPQSGVIRELAGMWLTMVLAMSGDLAGARTTDAERYRYFGDYSEIWRTDMLLTQAWLEAVHGSRSRAISFAMGAARTARTQGRPAQELWCLQTATQFGATDTVERLGQLAAVVQGPRAGLAREHAAALRRADGARLLSASNGYAVIGDTIAALDAAAQAVPHLHGERQRRAIVTAHRLATGGARTPAYRAMASTGVLTPRQREVIALAATGLSNREIADRLVMSVRTVEGHLFRACQRLGVNTRDELITLLADGTAS
ncbi:hypothetical protein BTO20_24640 [Mycobacterium dioxanotrophicus]|uniref:HTH luxR-type domain-containing protein n=1 Tax=Mycobacterium dioxanotrophicus TaxID=482462 RepID=A0A1Y0C7X5_9MYCO|nr:helix-turn-helix transcriptional regulator [Mycobacterium dioxanotrophicus]ART71309.1 hypothetical protein BTO20_24640 [Mycobacterium dioxanotrophicus]